jgi:hypothetical protein
VCLTLIGAPPANAQLPEQYWFGQLSLSKAWTVTKGAGVTVAVVDSGVKDTLGDLRGQVLPGADFSGQHTDGRSDSGAQCDKSGCYGHGTDMSLVIAGTGAGTGYEGVAPGVKILPVKVSTRTGLEASAQAIADGIRWAVDHGAKVVNVSLEHAGSCDAVEGPAVKYAYQHDVIVVAGAGNDGMAAVGAPADCPGALAVSATNGGPKKGAIPIWSGSNYGPEVAFTGIGVDMPQELLTGVKVLHANGTSQAAAITSANLALIRAHFPKLSAREVVARALWSVHNGAGVSTIGHRINDKIGYGMILPYEALSGDVPANFPNPIYDAWQKTLSSAPSGSDSSPGSSPSSSLPTIPTGPGQAPSPVRRADSGGSSNGVLIGVIIGIVVLLIIIIVAVVLSRRQRSTVSPGPGRT